MRKNIEIFVPNSYEDLVEAQETFYKTSKSKKNRKISGVFLILLALAITPLGFNFLIPVYIILGLVLFFLPKFLLELYSKIVFQFAQKFYGDTKVIISDDGVSSENKKGKTFKKWKVFKYLHEKDMLLLYYPRAFSFISVMNGIPKKYVKEEDWDNLLVVVKEKITLQQKKEKKLKFIYGFVMFGLIMLIELILIFGYTLLTQNIGLNLDPKMDKSLNFFVPVILFAPLLTFGKIKEVKPSLKKLIQILIGASIFLIALFLLPLIIELI